MRRALLAIIGIAWVSPVTLAGDEIDFVRTIQPIFAAKCVRCHGEEKQEANLRLDRQADARRGGDSGPPFDRPSSLLLQRITSPAGERMPPEGEPLSAAQIDVLRRWIASGAAWPEGVDKVGYASRYDWWSFRPFVRPATPAHRQAWGRSSIDDFVLRELNERGLLPSAEADRRTLYRRLSFDLIGLPPDPDDVEAFVHDPDPFAYDKLVDRLLASPQYGERWARHWLDVVHYGDTHGYDKDKPRPNAWPYRDYVIRSLNADKPYARFVEEQLAGDVLWPGTEDGLTATGFIAAGPWDFIGHAELPETKYDGQIARLLDRDDMVTNTFNTFCSLTVQCARCHHHKFDPVTQTDYYRLQADFAALDRAERRFDADPQVATRRAELLAQLRDLQEKKRRIEQQIAEQAGPELLVLNEMIVQAEKSAKRKRPVEYGYHSAIESRQDVIKWVQLDFGKPVVIQALELIGCDDDFNNIGAGFGFPSRYKVELSNDAEFNTSVQLVVDETRADVPNPGVKPVRHDVPAQSARFLRITATKLAPRMNDYIFALAECRVYDANQRLLPGDVTVMALDSIEAPPRWRKANLTDGLFPGGGEQQLAQLQRQREQLIAEKVRPETRLALAEVDRKLVQFGESLAQLPPPQLVFAGMIHTGSGNFVGTGGSGGKPRTIHVLNRGDLKSPGEEVGPGVLPLMPNEQGTLDLSPEHTEGDRRIALARWITRADHPLTWRSIVNRLWQYHFGRGLVDSPNDFGHMGRLPSHPELLDWLAVEFRDHGGSWKHLHRLMVTSAVYRQSSASIPDFAAKDSQNELLWRMNRRRLEAEAVRDSVLHVAGKLDDRMGGPAFQDFVVVKPEHSPHYEYGLYDPENAATHRRSVYRFLVRSQPQPFMTTLDCADPSMQVDKRNETVTALQALALLNNKLMLAMSQHAADRMQTEGEFVGPRIDKLFGIALSRSPTPDELAALTAYAEEYGLENVCRLLFNLNEFVFVD